MWLKKLLVVTACGARYATAHDPGRGDTSVPKVVHSAATASLLTAPHPAVPFLYSASQVKRDAADVTSAVGSPLHGTPAAVTSAVGSPLQGTPAAATSAVGSPLSNPGGTSAVGTPIAVTGVTVTVPVTITIHPGQSTVGTPLSGTSSASSVSSTATSGNGGGGVGIPPVLPPPPPPPPPPPGGVGGGGGGGDGGGDGNPTNPLTSPPTQRPSSEPVSSDTPKTSSQSVSSESPETSSPSSSSTASTSSSSSNSCSTTFTATYQSVFCSVTTTYTPNPLRRTFTQKEVVETADCSTLAYTTVTACDTTISDQATTTTSTIEVPVTSSTSSAVATSLPPDTIKRCGHDSCGADLSAPGCGITKNIDVAPKRMKDPEAGQWPGPELYPGNDEDTFMRGEVSRCSSYKGWVVTLEGLGLSTYNFFTFSQKPEQMAVRGLYGCTSVVAVSHKGAWMSHFYESPLFHTQDWGPGVDADKEFQKWVIDTLEVGIPPDAKAPKEPYATEYALGQLKDSTDAELNTNGWGHLFDASTNPKLFIFTPRHIFFDKNHHALAGQFDGGDAVLEYPDKVEKIRAKLQGMFPESPIYIKGYTPNQNADQEDEAFDSARGKILVQYQPAPIPDCPEGADAFKVGRAKYRIWFEGMQIFSDSWTAEWKHQIFDPKIDQESVSEASDDTIRPPGKGVDTDWTGTPDPPRRRDLGNSSDTQDLCIMRPSGVTSSPSSTAATTTPEATGMTSDGCRLVFRRQVDLTSPATFQYPIFNYTIVHASVSSSTDGFTYKGNWPVAWNTETEVAFPADTPLKELMTITFSSYGGNGTVFPSPADFNPYWPVEVKFGKWFFTASLHGAGDCFHYAMAGDNDNMHTFYCDFPCDGTMDEDPGTTDGWH